MAAIAIAAVGCCCSFAIVVLFFASKAVFSVGIHALIQILSDLFVTFVLSTFVLFCTILEGFFFFYFC